jgi:predicted alpha/beta hydrolase family esterase
MTRHGFPSPRAPRLDTRDLMTSAPRFAGKHVLIVHGYTASPAANWFPWLAETLRAEGARVDVPAMPAPDEPTPRAWAETLRALVPAADANTLLVGHSLGCISVLRHLLTLPAGTRIGGLLLVSGFDRPLSTLPTLRAFTDAPLDHAEVIRRAPRIASIYSDNDTIVTPAASRDRSASLRGADEIVAGAGHFLDREGFTRLPRALAALVAPRANARGAS